MKNIPRFAVVGHPNKGKSSIVSALAQDDSVQVSDTPGTTKRRKVYPLKVDGEIIYELIDTPGFQRARRVLAYINHNQQYAHRRFERILEFIKEYKNDPKFRDEIELLEPIVDGAGIIYVVDGSKPYGTEYEAEMEILRFTAMPSMALINIIGDEDYSKEWKQALNQYFKMVKTYNPLKAKFDDNIELLEAVSYLNEDWTKQIKNSIEILKNDHRKKIDYTAYLIASNIVESLSYVEKIEIKSDKVSDDKKEQLEKKYKNSIASFEANTQKKINSLWNHNRLQIVQNNLDILDTDLFSKQSQSLFGLSKQTMILTAVASGGVSGAAFDMLVGGSSLMMGSVIGATIGAASAFFAYDKLAEITILGQKLSTKELVIGPMKNINFPYILLGRSLLYAKVIINRSHAMREEENLKDKINIAEEYIDLQTRKSLEKLHVKFREEDEISQEDIENYSKLLIKLLKKIL